MKSDTGFKLTVVVETTPFSGTLPTSPVASGFIGILRWPYSFSSSLVARSTGHQSSVSKADSLPASGSQGARAMNHRSVLLSESGWQGPIIYLT